MGDKTESIYRKENMGQILVSRDEVMLGDKGNRYGNEWQGIFMRKSE